MKEGCVLIVLLLMGLAMTIILKTFLGLVVPAVGIPAYLAYSARYQNILAKSRLVDLDLFIMIGVIIIVVLAFETFSDPRLGLILLSLLLPLLFAFLPSKGRE
ncbi:hypothetical protein [Pyrococcus yayanosii]|uniref:Uncharacterized protein n=1 Tax=Pyrococcus yayanosii (strain CH1 / JCM 16557) TaxID=529709 RepID=F8AF08_PYRYC|nr:hypothetical protein [Pyrococcus yayanosii]AEH24845.1 hypothetical protein PYCH_11640 [Pyrococcus yayanosii CH1]